MEDKDYYKVPAISNSGMASINPEQGGTPARYKKYIIDRDKEEEDTPSLQNGKLIHLYVEDPANFIISDTERPTEKLAAWIEEVYWKVPKLESQDCHSTNAMLKSVALSLMEKYGNTKDPDKIWAKFCDGLDYLQSLIIPDGKLVITSSQKDVVETCVASLHDNDLANSLLFNELEDFGSSTHNELGVYWTKEVAAGSKNVKLKCKALLDRVRINPTTKTIELIDLKTTGKPISKFKDTLEYYRYYRQMAWYKSALIEYLKQEHGSAMNWKIEVYIVAVETSGLFECKVMKVNPRYLSKGSAEAYNLVSRIAEATDLDDWTTTQEERLHGYINLVPDEE